MSEVGGEPRSTFKDLRVEAARFEKVPQGSHIRSLGPDPDKSLTGKHGRPPAQFSMAFARTRPQPVRLCPTDAREEYGTAATWTNRRPTPGGPYQIASESLETIAAFAAEVKRGFLGYPHSNQDSPPSCAGRRRFLGLLFICGKPYDRWRLRRRERKVGAKTG